MPSRHVGRVHLDLNNAIHSYYGFRRKFAPPSNGTRGYPPTSLRAIQRKWFTPTTTNGPKKVARNTDIVFFIRKVTFFRSMAERTRWREMESKTTLGMNSLMGNAKRHSLRLFRTLA